MMLPRRDSWGRRRDLAARPRLGFSLSTCLWTALALLLLLAAPPARAARPAQVNFLVIVADDLRASELNMFGRPKELSVPTPGLDLLASTSTRFQRAFVQIAVCAPSRNSFLAGRRPDTLNSWNFLDPLRSKGNRIRTLPQVLKSAGYFTKSIGKVFHNIAGQNFDRTQSWTEISQIQAVEDSPIYQCPQRALACTCVDGSCADQIMSMDVRNTIASMRNKKAPWFIAVGFRLPHTPYSLPQAFRDQMNARLAIQPLAKHLTAKNFNESSGMPAAAFYSCDNLRSMKEYMSEPILPWQAVNSATAEYHRREYQIATAFMDAQILPILDDLAKSKFADNTVVVFVSDHGWHLGERGMWCKHSTSDLTTRVPLMIRVPWLPESFGKSVEAVVEVVDITPTLLALAGPAVSSTMNECYEGKDITSFLKNPAIARELEQHPFGGVDPEANELPARDLESRGYALSQFPRCGMRNPPAWSTSGNPWSTSCMSASPSTYDYMGYSIRTKRWRYTEWRVWRGALADWSPEGLNATELYDHGEGAGEDDFSDPDAFENVNVAANMPELVERFSRVLRLVSVPTSLYPLACRPTNFMTMTPTTFPTKSPTTTAPSARPTVKTKAPTTKAPTTRRPTKRPTTKAPTSLPPATAEDHTESPETPPTKPPTKAPTTCVDDADVCQDDFTCGVMREDACGVPRTCPCWSLSFEPDEDEAA